MARIRQAKICPGCGATIKYIHNKPKKEFYGDAGGHYETHSCPKGARQNLEKLAKQIQQNIDRTK